VKEDSQKLTLAIIFLSWAGRGDKNPEIGQISQMGTRCGATIGDKSAYHSS
jgi:hypothetical protein